MGCKKKIEKPGNLQKGKSQKSENSGTGVPAPPHHLGWHKNFSNFLLPFLDLSRKKRAGGTLSRIRDLIMKCADFPYLKAYHISNINQQNQ